MEHNRSHLNPESSIIWEGFFPRLQLWLFRTALILFFLSTVVGQHITHTKTTAFHTNPWTKFAC